MATNFWLVVTGTGRCGTKFTSMVLESVGVRCTHQYLFGPSRWRQDQETAPVGVVTDEDVSAKMAYVKRNPWSQEAESSWVAAPFIGLPEMKGITTVHLVRHPRKVINSLVKCQVFERRDRYGLYVDFVYNRVPEIVTVTTPIQRAGVFYLKWNEMLEGKTDFFWNVEKDARGLLDLLGIDHTGKEIFNDTQYNQRTGPVVDCQLGDFPDWEREALLDMTRRYGYEWP